MQGDHIGGCNVMMGDGSVRLMHEDVDLMTFVALSTRNKGDIPGGN